MYGLSQKGKGKKEIKDNELRSIINYISQKEPVVTALDVIKFLSETPLDELCHMQLSERSRKIQLCRELLSLIQDDLRNTI